MIEVVRCINCRTSFSGVDEYLVHECSPNPATAATWERITDEDVDELTDEEVAELLRGLEEIAANLDSALEQIENELAELDDPFFGDDDEDEYPVGFATLAVVSVLSIGFFGLLSAAVIARRIGRVSK